MTLPNFLIIGAAKSGTSALYHYLKQHPQIFMSSRKEPHFFSYEGKFPNSQGPRDYINQAIINLKDYEALFDAVSNETAIGEASPTYIYVPIACERIRYYVPDAKIIAILRQPADRAFSAFMHLRRDSLETIADFGEALAAESWRIEQNWGPIWHYKRCGYYFSQLSRYFEVFNKNQIRVYLFEDFKRDPSKVFSDLFQFLDVDVGFRPDTSTKPNVSGIPKSPIAQKMINSLFMEPNPVRSGARLLLPEELRFKVTTAFRNLNLNRVTIPDGIRKELTQEFRDDIKQLESLIGRDLSLWF